ASRRFPDKRLRHSPNSGGVSVKRIVVALTLLLTSCLTPPLRSRTSDARESEDPSGGSGGSSETGGSGGGGSGGRATGGTGGTTRLDAAVKDSSPGTGGSPADSGAPK